MPDLKLIEKEEHILFKIGVYAKGLNALIDLVSGFSLLFFSVTINNFFVNVIESEIIDDKADVFINSVYQSFSHLSVGATTILSIFILGHGLVNLFLFITLIKGKLWAFPVAMGIVCSFIIYQFYKYGHNHSIPLLVVTFLDIIFVILAWLEYTHKKRKRALLISRAIENI